MSMRPRHRQIARGLTLIEIILVMCLLVVMAAFSWPLLTRSFDAQRLRSAADLVRARLTRARIEAIDSGGTCQFRYAIDGRRFTISQSSCDNGANAAGSEAMPGDAAPRRSTDRLSGELPEGITFVAAQPAADVPPSDGETPLEAGETSWSEPIFFQPDGTTTSTTVRLRNVNGRSIDLTLRGLTGVVIVSDIFAEEDVR
jgi:Tfp pilus assembly protein FimT